MGKAFRKTRVVRDLRAGDLPGVHQILEGRIRAPETGEVLTSEVANVLEGMRRALERRSPTRFLVAVAPGGEVVGVVGVRPLAPVMAAFARGEHPVEMVHAFVAANLERSGLGSALVTALEERARQDGHDEVLLNSGPRYAASGWGFFDRQPGYERRGVLRDHYGPGQDAPVWGKRL
jgi:GNAT superfamily N-acetyltransferase